MADDLEWRDIIAPGGDPDPAAADGRPVQFRTRREAREEAERQARLAGEQPSRSQAPFGAGAFEAQPADDDVAAESAAAEPAAPEPVASGPVSAEPAEHVGVDALIAGLPTHDDDPHEDPSVGRTFGDGGFAGRDFTSGTAAGGGGRGGRGGRPPCEPRPPRRRRSRGGLIAGIVILALVVGGGIAGAAFVVPKVQSVVAGIGQSQQTDDYAGSGTGKVTITINDGDIGSDVAKTLAQDGVVKTSAAFYKLLLASPDIQFQPGSYQLKKHMSSKAALAALQVPSNKVTATVVVPEGEVLANIEDTLVSKAGLSRASVEAAAKDTSSYGLPAGVTSLEGYLFPATYPIDPSWTAKQYFQSMVTTMYSHLDAAGVAVADRQRVVTFASLVQKEAGLAADYPKVARVFQNRLDAGMDLQSDATVAYGTGHTDRVTTTDAERNDASNPYNTYQHAGLPPGPISNPGDIAIQAVMHPADGTWLYFVTVNLETGETAFSTTYAEHQAAVAQFQAWLRAHPSYQ